MMFSDMYLLGITQRWIVHIVSNIPNTTSMSYRVNISKEGTHMDDKVWEVIKIAQRGDWKRARKLASKLNNPDLNRYLAGRATVHPVTGEFKNQTNWWENR